MIEGRVEGKGGVFPKRVGYIAAKEQIIHIHEYI